MLFHHNEKITIQVQHQKEKIKRNNLYEKDKQIFQLSNTKTNQKNCQYNTKKKKQKFKQITIDTSMKMNKKKKK